MHCVKKIFRGGMFFLLISFFLFANQSLAGQLEMMPPHPQLIEQLKNTGGLQDLINIQQQMTVRGFETPAKRPEKSLFNIQGASNSPVDSTASALVLCVQFTDTAPQHSTAEFQKLLFGSSFGTMKDYFAKNSRGLFDLNGKVAGGDMAGSNQGTAFIKLPNPKSYYVGYQYATGSYPQNSQGIVVDAVNALKAANFDFTPYAANGAIPYLFVIVTGNGAEFTGRTRDIWSHSASLGSHQVVVKVDGGTATVDCYSIEPELKGDGNELNTIGVFCHEFGHILGLPDLYDTQNYRDSEGDGDWTVMAAGSWNGPHSDGSAPAEFDAFSKTYLGWINPDSFSGSGVRLSMPPVEGAGGQVYRITPAGSQTEYFLFENKQQTGYDLYLDGHGLLVWHIDGSMANPDSIYWRANEVNNISNGHYGVALVQADGRNDLEHGANRGDASDPFPGAGNVTSFTDNTTPGSKLYNGTQSNISLMNISEAGQNVNLVVTTTGHVAAVSLSADKTDPQPAGTAVTLTANAAVSNPVYQFWVKDPRDDSWTSSGEFGGGSYTLTRRVPGVYTVVVFAKSSDAPGSVPVQSAPFTFTFTKSGSVSGLLVSGPNGGQTTGGDATFTAAATDDGGTPCYEFWLHDAAGWRVVKNWSADNSFTLGNIQAGSYVIAATALDRADLEAGKWDMVYTKSFVLNAGSSVDLTAPAGVVSGGAVNLSAQAAGLTGAEYQFWYQAPDGGWRNSGDYTGNNTYSFIADTPGAYRVVVYAKDHYAPSTGQFAVLSVATVLSR
ncbi:M6 family metalloprotease domain-containing protein [Pelotomaculum propionicicum]|uniref:Immune inhibitor A n=1 Tax=Pelotomaculum propionicicum TaxID=258475 RepID=A0A4Y7RLI0_9FIRM|nr:M6 family metalloprotease domain-containing protein [Pelotomaculum propionicicum]TEB09723.1 Immune inhibitor A [Pelotomaculum propionicicum]